jgi:hypothetical protein
MAVESAPPTSQEVTPAQLSGYEIVKGELVVPSGSSTGTTTVNCPAGKKVFGGGSYVSFVEWSGPVGPDTPFPNGGVYGWKFGASYPGGGATFNVSVICANAS